MVPRTVAPLVVAVSVAFGAASPARAQAGLDVFLGLVPADADYVLSVDPDPLRGTRLWEQILPLVVGDGALFSHPDSASLVRFRAAGSVSPFPGWTVLAADGLFLRSDADPELDFFGALRLPVAYYHRVVRLPGAPPLYRVAVVSRRLEDLFEPSGPRVLAPLAAYAASLVPDGLPAFWGVVRLDGLRDLSWLPFVRLPLPDFLGAGFLFVGVDPDRGWRFSVVFELSDPVAAAAAAVELASMLRAAAGEGIVLSSDQPAVEGSRVRASFSVVPAFYAQLFAPVGPSR